MYRGAPDGRAPTPLPLLPPVLLLFTTAPSGFLLLLQAQPVQPQVVGEVERLLTGAAAPGLQAQPLLRSVRRAAPAMFSVGAGSWGSEPGGGGRVGGPGRSGGPGGVRLAAGRVIVYGPEAAQLRGEEGRGSGRGQLRQEGPGQGGGVQGGLRDDVEALSLLVEPQARSALPAGVKRQTAGTGMAGSQRMSLDGYKKP